MDRLKRNSEKAAEERKKTSESAKSNDSYFTKIKNAIGSVFYRPNQQQSSEPSWLGMKEHKK
jgi:hypothetical protein